MAKPFMKMDIEAANFFTALDRFAREAHVPIEKANKAVALQFLAVVKQRTPVDTGAARAAWRIKALYGGLECHVYNEINYITALEYGSSKQAPNGMVRISLAELTGNLLKEPYSIELQKYLASIHIGMTRKETARYWAQLEKPQARELERARKDVAKYRANARKESMRDMMENAGM